MEKRKTIKKRIKKITISKNQDVYDITTEKNHNFFANDCLVHNCAEIILRPNEFCNLSSVIIRPNDKLADLCEKVKMATVLGILQSTLTKFVFLRKEWEENTKEERLLGISLTGMMDHKILSNEKNPERMEDWLSTMKETAIKTAKKWSKALDISMPTATTCVKPEGTVSQLLNTASGLHPRFSPYYLRRVRVSTNDPLSKLLKKEGVPCFPETGQTLENCSTLVFEFPLESPKKSKFRYDKTALQQLEHWKIVQNAWCEHKPSITVYVRESEWLEVGAWVYTNWDIISGVSFLPYDNGIYPLAPFEEITQEKYKELIENFPKNIDFKKLTEYESSDYTLGSKEYACVGGSCELI